MSQRFLFVCMAPTLFVISVGIAACGAENSDNESSEVTKGKVSLDSACDSPGTICTWGGSGEAAFDGDGNTPLMSDFYWPIDMTITKGGEMYVLDWNNHRVRHVQADGTLMTVIGTDFLGDGPDDKSDLTEPGAMGTDVHLNHPTQLLERPDGRLVLLAWHNHKLRTYDPETGRVVVTCGGPPGFGGDGGPAAKAKINQPNQGAMAPDGTVYILDQRNQVIRKIDTNDMMSTVAGTPMQAGFEGDGGDPLAAKLSFPAGGNPPPAGGLAVGPDGNIYISDTSNHRVRKVDFAKNTITTIAGTGEAGYSGDNGPATSAKINNPRKLAFGPDGRLYLADENNHRIRAIDLATGIIETVVGTGEASYTGDGGPAENAGLHRPAGLVFDPNGKYLYVADTYNHVIRRVAL